MIRRATKCHLIKFPSRISLGSLFFRSALSSNGGVLSIDFDKLSVKEAIHNINYVRALAGLDHVGLGSTSSPKKYALLLAELARDRLWNNASLKKLVGGNIVRILREVWLD
jgi:membrane dipeptidase